MVLQAHFRQRPDLQGTPALILVQYRGVRRSLICLLQVLQRQMPGQRHQHVQKLLLHQQIHLLQFCTTRNPSQAAPSNLLTCRNKSKLVT